MASLQVQVALTYLQTILTPEQLNELRGKLCANRWQYLLRIRGTHTTRRDIIHANSRAEAMRIMLASWELVGFILSYLNPSQMSDKLLEVRSYYIKIETRIIDEVNQLIRKKFGSVEPYVDEVFKLFNTKLGDVFLLELTNDLGTHTRPE